MGRGTFQVGPSHIQPGLKTRPGMGHPELLCANCPKCITTLTVKNFFLICNPTLASFSLNTLLHILSLPALAKSFYTCSLYICKVCSEVSSKALKLIWKKNQAYRNFFKVKNKPLKVCKAAKWLRIAATLQI